MSEAGGARYSQSVCRQIFSRALRGSAAASMFCRLCVVWSTCASIFYWLKDQHMLYTMVLPEYRQALWIYAIT